MLHKPVFALVLLSSMACASLVPGPDLARRIQEADIIVVGTVVSGTTTASSDQTETTVSLQAERVLKGSIISGTNLTAHIAGRGDFIQPQTSIRPAPKLHGIWFLKSTGATYGIVSRQTALGEIYRACVQLPVGAAPDAPEAQPAQAVANELLAALDRLSGTRSETMEVEQSLRSLPTEVAHEAYKTLSERSAIQLQVMGIAGLISLQDPTGPKRAAAEWNRIEGDSAVHAVVQSLGEYHNAGDPDAVRAIAQLALSSSAVPMLRENASYALRAIHTGEAMPALAALLESTEPRVLANALPGVCLFVRNAVTVTPESVRSMSWMASQTPAPFRNAAVDKFCWLGGSPAEAMKQTEAIAFWKTWWLLHSGEVLAPR